MKGWSGTRKRFKDEPKGVEGAAVELVEELACFSVINQTHVLPNFRNHQRWRVAPASGALSG